MRIENCKTEGVDAVVAAPLERDEAEPDWLAANEAGVVSAALMRLYQRAHFLSFGKGPRFLADDDSQLFSYFSLMLRGVKGSLTDTDEELGGFDRAEAMAYDLGKSVRGEPWDSGAPARAKRHLRLVLLSLCASLDCIAELTALLLPRTIPGLKLGKAEFNRIEEWLKLDEPFQQAIISPQQSKARDLYKALKPLVESQGEEKEWLPLAKLLRNKASHLGTDHFREMGFHDEKKVFYTFLPKRWPLLWEEHIKRSDSKVPRPTLPMEQIIAPLMRQDKISYLHGLRAKVTRVVDAAIEILDSAYADFEQFEIDAGTLDDLKHARKEFAFQAFPESENPLSMKSGHSPQNPVR
jgi:hypothetical protein